MDLQIIDYKTFYENGVLTTLVFFKTTESNVHVLKKFNDLRYLRSSDDVKEFMLECMGPTYFMQKSWLDEEPLKLLKAECGMKTNYIGIERTVKPDEDKLCCDKCKLSNEYATPNTSDGKYICYECR